MQQKNNPAWFYYFYMIMYSMLFKSNCTHVRVIRNQSNVIICFYLDFQTKKMYYCTSALIDHSDSLWKNGSYFFQINEIIQLSFNKCIPLVRLGPTTDELKTKFGGKVKRFKILPGYNKLSIKD